MNVSTLSIFNAHLRPYINHLWRKGLPTAFLPRITYIPKGLLKTGLYKESYEKVFCLSYERNGAGLKWHLAALEFCNIPVVVVALPFGVNYTKIKWG